MTHEEDNKSGTGYFEITDIGVVQQLGEFSDVIRCVYYKYYYTYNDSTVVELFCSHLTRPTEESEFIELSEVTSEQLEAWVKKYICDELYMQTLEQRCMDRINQYIDNPHKIIKIESKK